MRNGLPSNNTNNNNNNRNRNRNRNNSGGGGGGGRPQNSNGYRPDNRGNNERVRGNASQLMEKYKNLARDAASAGDRVLGEYYMQHADHYFRVLAEFRARYEETRPRDQRQDENENQDENSNGNRNSEDQAPEGVDTVDLAASAGFGAAASMATFGADGPPSTEPSDQNSETTSNGNDENSDQNNTVEQEQQSPRRSRSRGRPRKADADPLEG